MRTAIEFMGILEKEAANLAASTTAQTRVGIVVQQDSEPFGGNVVWHDGMYRQAHLDALLKNGGEPVGLIRIDDNVSDEGKISISSRTFDECRGDSVAEMALWKMCRTWYHKMLDDLAWCFGDDVKGVRVGDPPNQVFNVVKF